MTACMYYRRNVRDLLKIFLKLILSIFYDKVFHFELIVQGVNKKWKQRGVLVLLRICSSITIGIAYFLLLRIKISKEVCNQKWFLQHVFQSASDDLIWLHSYPNVLYFTLNSYTIAILCGSNDSESFDGSGGFSVDKLGDSSVHFLLSIGNWINTRGQSGHEKC